MRINVFNTRIEILPYELGSIPKLEKKWSIWVKAEYKYDPIACCYTDSKLIVPRGMSLTTLTNMIGTSPSFVQQDYVPAKMEHAYIMKTKPRDTNQIQAINFLLSINGFEKYERKSQLALNLDTGIGKTYCAIYSIITNKERAIVITHTQDIKSQWYESFLKYSSIYEDKVCDIDSGKILEEIFKGNEEYINKDVFLVTHSMITDFAGSHGWDYIKTIFTNLRLGIKVVDETHLCFKNIMMIDFFSNVPRNYYLTATFGRSDAAEQRIFNQAFGNAVRYGAELNSRKHINYQFVFFNSNPTQIQERSIKTNYGVSSYRYADYAFKTDEFSTLESVMYQVLDQCLLREGRTLIVVPKIENTEYLTEKIKEKYPSKEVGSINSKKSEEENVNIKENADIIVSTVKSLGTGSDIKKLRNLIIAEPHSSKIISRQLIGRLREYSTTEDTYAYELTDVGFKAILRMVSRRLGDIRKKCKTVTQTRI